MNENDLRVLRMPEVAKKTGLSVNTIYRRIAAGKFPAQIRLGENSVGWRSSDVDAWIAARATPAVAQ